jgi:hypothetical protein
LEISELEFWNDFPIRGPGRRPVQSQLILWEPSSNDGGGARKIQISSVFEILLLADRQIRLEVLQI